MKKFLTLLMTLMLLSASALADTVMLNPEENRGIQIIPADVNDMEDGISPTTGRNLDEVAEEAPDGAQGYAVIGRYMPILVQISNPEGGYLLWVKLPNRLSSVELYKELLQNDKEKAKGQENKRGGNGQRLWKGNSEKREKKAVII